MQRRPKRTDRSKREEIEERPKWEDLNTDCLVNIFLRLDMENMLLDVPYVCKSWYKVTCTPQCWTTLSFTNTYTWRVERDCYERNFSCRMVKKYNLLERVNQRNSSAVTRFIKHVVKRSNGLATSVKLPSCCTQEAIIFISNECPNLKTLLLPLLVQDFPTWQFPSFVSKWKRLEKLRLCWSFESFDTREIIVQIGLHCNKFEALEISKGGIVKEEACALGAFLPNLKVLGLIYTRISKENLLVILKSCKKLEVLDARHCLGFHEGDDDILKSAAHITQVSFEGSRLNDDYYYHSDDYDDYDDHSDDYYYHSENPYCDGCVYYDSCDCNVYNYCVRWYASDNNDELL